MNKFMKLLFGVLIVVLCTSCSEVPTACFEVDSNIQRVTDYVRITNCSIKAKRFEWDFGDGNTSSQRNPAHSYASPGKYEIKLTVRNGLKEDVTTQIVEILPNSTGGGVGGWCC